MRNLVVVTAVVVAIGRKSTYFYTELTRQTSLLLIGLMETVMSPNNTITQSLMVDASGYG